MRVAAGVCLRDGRVLMGRRKSSDPFYPGYWEFPGGKIEAGESEQDALRREFAEELDSTVLSLRFLKEVVWDYSGRTVVLRFYSVTIAEDELSSLKLNAHDELRWFSREEAMAAQVLAANRGIFEEVFASASL